MWQLSRPWSPNFGYAAARAEEELTQEAQGLGVEKKDLMKAAACEKPYLLGCVAKMLDEALRRKGAAGVESGRCSHAGAPSTRVPAPVLAAAPRGPAPRSPLPRAQAGAAGKLPFAAREMSPLVRAAKANDEAVVGMLLDNGAPVSDTDADGNTALHWVLRQVRGRESRGSG